jgi:DNA-binding XRE family transcriptional regulator
MCVNNFMTLIRKRRRELSISQVDFVHLSGVSLPTLQNIEVGKANPSIKIMSKILNSLGYQIEIVPSEPNWDLLISIGLPITTKKKFEKIKYTLPQLALYLQHAAEYIIKERNKNSSERYFDALKGLLLAIKIHYPSLYEKLESESIAEILNTDISGRHIKLYKMALSSFCKYLKGYE